MFFQISFIIFFKIILLTSSFCTNFEKEEEDRPYVMVIPGQNGLGGQSSNYIFHDDEVVFCKIKTPDNPDLGQKNCLKLLEKEMKAILDHNSQATIIIHGSSQGTATALNYTSANPTSVKALILEAVLPSGNSAIAHTVENFILPGIKKVPGYYYFLPYLAKIKMPFYNPAGLQPILNIDALPTNIPIIILHSKLDPQLSYEDAQALYAGLQSRGNLQTYLISLESDRHLELIRSYSDLNISVIRDILQKNNILGQKYSEDPETLRLNLYQPPVVDLMPYYHDLVSREKFLHKIDHGLKFILMSAPVLGLYLIYNYYLL